MPANIIVRLEVATWRNGHPPRRYELIFRSLHRPTTLNCGAAGLSAATLQTHGVLLAASYPQGLTGQYRMTIGEARLLSAGHP